MRRSRPIGRFWRYGEMNRAAFTFSQFLESSVDFYAAAGDSHRRDAQILVRRILQFECTTKLLIGSDQECANVQMVFCKLDFVVRSRRLGKGQQQQIQQAAEPRRVHS